MLHILWMIIKILLIFLAVVLGLILAVILLILLCPIRYQAAGMKQDSDIHGRAKVSWLFGAVAAVVSYSDRKATFQLRLLGISLETYQRMVRKIRGLPKHDQAERQIKEYDPDPEAKKADISEQTPRLPGQESDLRTPKSTEEPEKEATVRPECAKEADDNEVTGQLSTEANLEESEDSFGIFAAAGRICRTIVGALLSVFRKIFSIGNTIIHIPQKIGRSIHKVWKSICRLCANIEKWKAFMDDEHTRGAIGIVWRETRRLLRHISPRKVKGKITFGLENPCITGQLYGLICATCPIHHYIIDAEPVFDDTRLDAELSLKGRIYLIIPAISGLKLLLDKNIQFLIRLRKKED